MKNFILFAFLMVAMFAANAQNVGVGESSPTTRLEVKGHTSGDLLNIKTNTGVSRLYVMEGGNVGIGTAAPLGPLTVGNSNVDGSDGFLVLGKRQGGPNRHFRLGFDASFNFVIGDFGSLNVAGTWTNPFSMAWDAPNNSFRINASGNVGIGTNSPTAKLHVITNNSNGIAGAWGAGQFVVGLPDASGANSGGVGLSYSTTDNAGYLSALSPAHSWRNMGYRATEHIFFSTAGETETMRINSAGRVLITKGSHAQFTNDAHVELFAPNNNNSTTDISIRFHHGGKIWRHIRSHSDGEFRFTNEGSTYVPCRASAFNATSDKRIKSQHQNMPYGLNEILQIIPKKYFQHHFEFQDGKIVLLNEGKYDIGFMAQELYQFIPEAVTKPLDETNDTWAVEYSKIIPVLVKAIQEQQAEIEVLKVENAKIAKLEAALAKLESYIYSEAKK